MELLGNNYVRIILSTITVYLFLIVAIRLFGKKELAQLSVFDLVFILLISNVVQNAMTGPDTSLSGGLTGAAALFLVNFLLKSLEFRFPVFSRAIQGEAVMLIFKGKVNHRNLDRVKITMEELLETVREHGVSNIEEVDLAVLEVDGNISVLSDQFRKKTTRKRKAHKIITRNQ
ncbi:MAG: DUF421 domain-containing protein [Bacteroidota bacterium]|nr:DUF421 domain-containing protein [Bacteroidota bacterium]